MNTINLKKLTSLQSISINFGISEEFLNSVITSPEDYYKEMKIPKKGKRKDKFRRVFKAVERLAHFHSELKKHIERNVYRNHGKYSELYISKHATGFIKKKGTLKNARIHLNKKKLQNLDIEKFFKSIPIRAVYQVFIKLEVPPNGAKILSNICTFKGRLEEGLHTSPIISNIYCKELDLDLFELAQKRKCCYSRYADDISFSGDFNTPNLLSIQKCLDKYGFKLNRDKTRFSKQGQAQYVTGLSVSDKKYPRVPKPMKRKLRMELYYIKKYGIKSHCNKLGIENSDIDKEVLRIEGWIRYLSGIEPTVGNNLTL